jgi:hypothetical protein
LYLHLAAAHIDAHASDHRRQTANFLDTTAHDGFESGNVSRERDLQACGEGLPAEAESFSWKSGYHLPDVSISSFIYDHEPCKASCYDLSYPASITPHLMSLGKVYLEIASVYAYVQLKPRTPDLRDSAKG